MFKRLRRKLTNRVVDRALVFAFPQSALAEQYQDFEAACDYTTDVPIFESGAAAAEHGKAEIAAPSEKASRTVERILKKPSPMAPRSQG